MKRFKSEIISKLTNDIIFPYFLEKENLTVAELFSDELNGLVRTRDTNTAIISQSLVSKIRASHINIPVKWSGIDYTKEVEFKPLSHLYLSPASGLRKAEPFVKSWTNGNHTTLHPDQGFLSTYGLSPRLTNEATFWDDLSKPKYDIVENKPLSFYEFPIHSEAFVKVNRKYLSDYLALRKKVAVTIYQEVRDIKINDDILYLLNQNDFFVEEYDQYEVRLSRYSHKDEIARLEVNGYYELFKNTIKYQNDKSFKDHFWKGIEKPISGINLMHKIPFEYIYVLDDVLAKYEEDEDYEVQPESGSVSYGIHWSVSHCDRIGRNAIRIELKKLYESTPYDVIDYWNQYSIDPKTINEEEENIAEKSIRLVRKYLLFGKQFSDVINRICDFNFLPLEIIALDEKTINYQGFVQNEDIKPIMNHVSAKVFSKEKFMVRCKNLNVLLVENLREKNLRKIVDDLGFSTEETKYLGSLKLLELIMKYLFIAQNSGLHPKNSKGAIIARIDELKDLTFIPELQAINAIRQLDAHKSKNFNSKFIKALTTLGIDRKSITNNYSNSCHLVYDRLSEMFNNLNNLISRAEDF